MTARTVLARIWFPVFCLVLFCLLLWLGLANRSLYFELKSEGKTPVSVGPISTPSNGRDGKSAYDIWIDAGNQGTRTDFLSSLEGSDGRPGRDGQSIQGDDGRDGEDGTAGRDGVSIKGDRGEPGIQGIQGVPGNPGESIRGETGAAGANGRSPQIGCVIRTVNNVPVNYIAWRYSDEADTAYRNLYRVPGWAQAEGCVNV